MFSFSDTDECFGGVPIQGITEISGEAGSGKTQICLSLALEVNIISIICHFDYFTFQCLQGHYKPQDQTSRKLCSHTFMWRGSISDQTIVPISSSD